MNEVIVRLEINDNFRRVTFINSETGEKIVLKSRNKKTRKSGLGFAQKGAPKRRSL
jgi:hypothetical protein